MEKNKIKYILLLIVLFVVPIKVKAELTGATTINCDKSTVASGASVTCHVYYNVASGGLTGFVASIETNGVTVSSVTFPNGAWSMSDYNKDIAKLSVFSSDAKNGNVHIGDIVVVVNGNPGSNSSLILKSVSAVDDSDNNVADSNRTASFSIASDDNKLKSLKVDGRALTAPYSATTDKSSATIEALANHNKATITGGGVKSNLKCGLNSFTVTVTAENGSAKDYNVDITRTCNSNTYLKSLSVQPGVISFDKNVKSYSVNVGGEVKSVTIAAKVEDAKSVVSGDGEKSLKYGDNKFVVTVTAEDGTKGEYTINVNREDNRNTDNKLKSLSITDFYKPGEDALLSVDSSELESKNNFSVTVENDVESINVKAVANDSSAKISGNVGKINLKVGSNKVNVTVTAENEKKNVYSITVVRKSNDGSAVDLDDDNSLSMVEIAGYSLDFDPEVFEYEIELDEVVDQLELSAIPSSENATINIVGNEDLKPGVNEVIIEVTAESGEVKKYVLKVTLPGGETGSVAVESTTNNNVKPEEKKGSSVLLILCGVLVAAGIGGVVFVLLSKKKKNKDTNYKPVDKVEPASSLLSTNEVKTETNTSSNLNASSSVSFSNTNSNNSILEQAAVLETAKASEPIKEEPKVEPIPSIDIRPVSATTPSVEIKPAGMDLSKVSEPVVSPVVEESPVIKSEPSINTSDFANIAESAVSQSIPDVRTIPEVRDIPEPHEMPEEKLVSEIKTVSEVSDNTLTDTQLVQTIQNVSVENINIDDL